MGKVKRFIARLLVVVLLMLSFSSIVVLAKDETSTETENKALTEDEISTEDSETVTPFIAGKPGDKVWTKNMSGTNGYTLATLELVTYGSQYPDGYKIIESWREGRSWGKWRRNLLHESNGSIFRSQYKECL